MPRSGPWGGHRLPDYPIRFYSGNWNPGLNNSFQQPHSEKSVFIPFLLLGSPKRCYSGSSSRPDYSSFDLTVSYFGSSKKIPFGLTSAGVWALAKESACRGRRHKSCGFNPWVGKMPWRRKWQSAPVLLPWDYYGQRRLGPWGHKELDMTEYLNTAGVYLSYLQPKNTNGFLTPRWIISSTKG